MSVIPIAPSYELLLAYRKVFKNLLRSSDKKLDVESRHKRSSALNSEHLLIEAGIFEEVSALGGDLNSMFENVKANSINTKHKFVSEFQQAFNKAREVSCQEQFSSWVNYRLTISVRKYGRWKDAGGFKRWFYQGRRPYQFDQIRLSDTFEICSIDTMSSSLIGPWASQSHMLLNCERKIFNMILDSGYIGFLEKNMRNVPFATIEAFYDVINNVIESGELDMDSEPACENLPKYCLETVGANGAKVFVFWTGRGRTPRMFDEEFRQKGRDKLVVTRKQIELLNSGALMPSGNIRGSTLKKYHITQ
ncbi:hypothetical protein V6259_12975 [Marinomonas sp. TI.3.20]|uniref:hypothetical protein n=1 Tax=Marinomonas sp. TI.3.20 TaxID=3121296 RepID=UPI00311F0FC3